MSRNVTLESDSIDSSLFLLEFMLLNDENPSSRGGFSKVIYATTTEKRRFLKGATSYHSYLSYPSLDDLTLKDCGNRF